MGTTVRMMIESERLIFTEPRSIVGISHGIGHSGSARDQIAGHTWLRRAGWARQYEEQVRASSCGGRCYAVADGQERDYYLVVAVRQPELFRQQHDALNFGGSVTLAVVALIVGQFV